MLNLVKNYPLSFYFGKFGPVATRLSDNEAGERELFAVVDAAVAGYNHGADEGLGDSCDITGSPPWGIIKQEHLGGVS